MELSCWTETTRQKVSYPHQWREQTVFVSTWHHHWHDIGLHLKEDRKTNFQEVVGVLLTVGLKNRFLITNRKCRVNNTRVIKKHLLILQFQNNSLCADSTSSLAHHHGNVPKRESQNVSVCAKGHMNYGLTLTEGLILIDPELIIFGGPQSLPVSRCYNVHPESVSQLAAAPATGRL